MTNEEFQRLVLEKLTGLEHGQSRLEEGQVKLEQRQTKLEERQVKLEKRIDEVESVLTAKVEALDVKVNALDTKIDALDAKVERYGQSQQDDVKGLLEMMDKKLDSIIAKQIVQGESINILAIRQLRTESELAALKKAL